MPCSSTPAPDAALDVFAAALLDDHAVDAVETEQLREQESRGTCADDADLSGLRSPARILPLPADSVYKSGPFVQLRLSYLNGRSITE